ncbi:MAG: ATG16 family protein [Paludibacter sp.]|nr:ATG16 family protein [Bacteroidales bacterium]MCM1069762.1 ATG16 family protein [Prevotella sp.]MCM1354447.1 ATG16 family protein [Bacteroides sp.]MCM1443215.1 ATG16 family protein [Muribaculum sp.]MCM1482481.1 ATG16 family protein [Paludibacter sp.]
MKKHLSITLITLLLLLSGAVIYLYLREKQTRTDMQEMVDIMSFEKEQLEEEYKDLAWQFDGYGAEIHNDSLVALLSQEQQRVQDLLEELRITKATNARRIAELKKELATVRAIMVDYVHQIDSLDRTNKQLVNENRQVRQQYQEATQKATRLEEERNQLTEVVNRASMMEVTDFSIITLNKNNRKTNIFNKIQKLQFNYTLLKNITATPGQKIIYLRIVRPDGEVLQKRASDLFRYENQDIAWSVKKEFEYGGEEISDVLYWNVEEILQAGTYNADFFIDGNLVGSFPFSIKK